MTYETKRRVVRLRMLFVGLLFASLAFGFLTNAQQASAAYNGARLIDDAVFRDRSTMTRSQIQAFLESKNSGLKDKSFTLNCASAGAQSEALYESAGAPCGEKVRASYIIYFAAKIYSVNPQVILATLQKEQGLITTTNPTSWQLNQAMGYDCPTDGGCGSSTFFYQVDNGTWVLRFHYERARGNNSYWFESDSWVCGTTKKYYKPSLYPNVGTVFYDGNGVAYRSYNLSNPATSALYCYTPHAYNNPDGLYGLPKFGTKGQYYTGSYNFVKSFEAWFGSTTLNVSDQTIIGDWDGDGTDTLGLKRGRTYMLDNNNDGTEDVTFGFGKPTDQVIVGDWDNDGKDEIGLKRGREYFLDTNNDGVSNAYQSWGRPTDQVIVGDWDNDGKDELGLRRGREYFLNTTNDGTSDYYVSWGKSTDKVIVGDWDGDGDDTLGLKRDREHFLDNNNDGSSDDYVSFGRSSDKPIVGDWDGDNNHDIGLKRYTNYYYYDYEPDSVADESIIFGYY